MSRRREHLAKIPENVWSNDVSFVCTDKLAALIVGGGDIKMVVPEVDHHFFYLGGRVHSAVQPGRNQLFYNLALRPVTIFFVILTKRPPLFLRISIGIDSSRFDRLLFYAPVTGIIVRYLPV